MVVTSLRARILVAASILALASAAAVIGYLVSPGPDSPHTREQDLAPFGVDGDVNGALVTVARSGPVDSNPTYEVTVLADSAIESVVLRAGGSEIDRFEPDGDVTVLSIAFQLVTTDPVDAVATLVDGRLVTSNSLSPAFEQQLTESEEPPDSGAVKPAGGSLMLSSAAPVEPGAASVPNQAGSGVTWTGPGELHGGVLTVHEPGVGRVFFYITDDGENWNRVPSAAGASVALANGQVDLTGQLPALEGNELTLEIWQHDGFPALLGTARAITDTTFQVAEPNGVFGFLGRLDLDLISGEGDDEQLVRGLWLDQDEWSPIDLQWGTDLPNTTHIVWQAYDHRPSSDPNPLDDAPVRVGVDLAGGDGKFTFVPPGTPQPDGGVLVGSVETGQDFLSYGVVSGLLEPTTNDTTLPSDLKRRLAGPAASPESPSSWFLRAYAFSGDNWTGVSSNLVGVHLGKPPKLKQLPPEGTYKIDLIVYQPRPIDMAFRQCWEVRGIDQASYEAHRAQADGGEWQRTVRDYAFLNAILAKYTPTHGPIICAGKCYEGLDPDFPVGSDFQKQESAWALLGIDRRWDYPVGCSNDDGCSTGLGSAVDAFCDAISQSAQALVNLVIDGYNAIKKAYDDIKAEVVDFAVKLSGCEAIASEDACQTLGNLAANAALATVGLPPSLPSTEELKNAAEGDLEKALVDFAEDTTGLCSYAELAKEGEDDLPTCEQLAADIIDEAVKIAEDAVRSDARNSYGLPFPPGVDAAPDTRGNPAPLRVTVRVIPEEGMTLGPTCDVTVVANIAWRNPSFKLDLDPWPLYWPPATDIAWNLWPVTYDDWYDTQTVRFPKPKTDKMPAELDVYLAPPSGPSNHQAWRSVPNPAQPPPLDPTGAYASPYEPEFHQTWTLPRDLLVLQPGAELTVVGYASCANGDIVTGVLGQ